MPTRPGASSWGRALLRSIAQRSAVEERNEDSKSPEVTLGGCTMHTKVAKGLKSVERDPDRQEHIKVGN